MNLLQPAMTTLLGYTPFLDPLPIDRYWMWLIVPLVVLVSLTYKTLKVTELSQLPRQAGLMALQVLAFMVCAAVAVWLLTEVLL